MNLYLNQDNALFQFLRNDKYIDKSDLITLTNKVIDTYDCCICVTRPRRFGKSAAARMLNAYYSKGCDSRELFSDLKIASSPDFEKHLNQHDVIFLDMTSFADRDGYGEKFLEKLNSEVVSEFKETYPERFDKDHDYSLFDAIRTLGKRVIFIIDEWDFVFREYPDNKILQKNYIFLLNTLFKGVGSRFVELAYITGILPIARYNTQTVFNNFSQYSILNSGRFAKYYGFTEDETRYLCEKYHLDFEKTKQWYGCYKVGDFKIYNPWSIINMICHKSVASYWSRSASYSLVTTVINSNFEGLKEDVIKLSSGQTILARHACCFNTADSVFHTKEAVLIYLVYLGYIGDDLDNNQLYLQNEETRRDLLRAIRDNHWSLYENALKLSNEVIFAARTKDTNSLAVLLSKVAENEDLVEKQWGSNNLQNVVLMAFIGTGFAYFAPKINFQIDESLLDKGEANIVYIPQNGSSHDLPAYVIEIKNDATAKVALEQIKKPEFFSKVNEFADTTILIGINYDPQAKQFSCKIEEYTK